MFIASNLSALVPSSKLIIIDLNSLLSLISEFIASAISAPLGSASSTSSTLSEGEGVGADWGEGLGTFISEEVTVAHPDRANIAVNTIGAIRVLCIIYLGLYIFNISGASTSVLNFNIVDI